MVVGKITFDYITDYMVGKLVHFLAFRRRFCIGTKANISYFLKGTAGLAGKSYHRSMFFPGRFGSLYNIRRFTAGREYPEDIGFSYESLYLSGKDFFKTVIIGDGCQDGRIC